MNICHVNLASGYSGGENQTMTLIREQLRRGYQLSVITNPRSPLAMAARDAGCHVIETPHFLLKHGRSVTHGCDALHVHEAKAVYWALLQHLLTGIPYLITRRVDNPVKQKALLRLAYRRAARVIGLSSAIANEIEKALPSVATEIIPSSPVSYPVNPEAVSQIRQRFNGKFLVIQAAKLYRHKGYDVSIEAARLLQETHKDIQFCFLGDGPEESMLKNQASGLDNVCFTGKQSNMGDWFEAANLLIHPSHSEGLGSVILEASMAGLPVIGTCAGGIPDIIQDGENGLLIDPGQPQQLADAILRMRDDSSLIEHIHQHAPTCLEPFLISHTATRYEEIYQSL